MHGYQIMKKIELKAVLALIERTSLSILRKDNAVHTALCKVNERYFRVSIVYDCNSVVFTDTKTNEQIVKLYT